MSQNQESETWKTWIGHFPNFIPFLMVPRTWSLIPKDLSPLLGIRNLHVDSIYYVKDENYEFIKNIRDIISELKAGKEGKKAMGSHI